MLEYKGYYAEVSVDVEYGILYGRSVGMRDGFTFQAKSVDEIKPAFQEAVDDYLEFCAEDGVEPAKPFSGKIALRVEPDVHQQASAKAKEQGKSLNTWIAEAVARALIDPQDFPWPGIFSRAGMGNSYVIPQPEWVGDPQAMRWPPEDVELPGPGATYGWFVHRARLPVRPSS